MTSAIKKAAAFILVAIVIALTVLALLGVWEVIEFENVIRKILISLFVVFASSVVVLFIFTVIIREPKEKIQS